MKHSGYIYSDCKWFQEKEIGIVVSYFTDKPAVKAWVVTNGPSAFKIIDMKGEDKLTKKEKEQVSLEFAQFMFN